jgi:hypothetical protein
VLLEEHNSIRLEGLPLPELQIDLELNYGKEFLEIDQKIQRSLKKENSGLYLFSGAPGTGKTSYIQYLTTLDLGRKIILIPIEMVGSLTQPEFLPFLMEHKNAILILEDAEKALLDREHNNHSGLVSTILNLTDGFIGKAFNISILCSFNIHKDAIDPALLRKGRLRCAYEFKTLPETEAKILAEKLGKDPALITGSVTLADIYHLEYNPGKFEKPKIGFNS